ncbi:MAG: hypothetical protein FJ399_16215 [Verrucomicrobia bacterium]|nr:hypothetical protein [Verrucomicrobiota bacterium]
MKAWSQLVVAVVAVAGIANLAHTARRVPAPPRLPPAVPENAVMRHEERFAPMRATLHRHGVRGTLGYLADLPAAQLAREARAMEEYFLTQFVLAPWVIEAAFGDCAWAVANLRNETAAARVPAGYAVVEDFGRGVLLLRRIER